jgi:hypothetical protein
MFMAFAEVQSGDKPQSQRVRFLRRFTDEIAVQIGNWSLELQFGGIERYYTTDTKQYSISPEILHFSDNFPGITLYIYLSEISLNQSHWLLVPPIGF